MTQRMCPDCDKSLTQITVVDRQGSARPAVGLAFTQGQKPQRSAWSGKLTNQAGTINGWMCQQCKRVLFYAE